MLVYSVFFNIALIKNAYTQLIFLSLFLPHDAVYRRLTRSWHKTIYPFIPPSHTSYPWGLPGPGLGGFHITLISEEEMANACTSEGGSLGSAFKSSICQISEQITHKTHHQSYTLYACLLKCLGYKFEQSCDAL